MSVGIAPAASVFEIKKNNTGLGAATNFSDPLENYTDFVTVANVSASSLLTFAELAVF